MLEARQMAKRSKDYGASDNLRRELSARGVTIDDQTGRWRSSDGRMGVVPGSRGRNPGPTVPQAMAGAVDRKGVVSKEAAAEAANAAALGWVTTPKEAPMGLKRGGAAAQRALPEPSAARAAKQARHEKRARADPMDPSSWEGYQVPTGGWGRGLPPQGGAAPAAGGATTADAARKSNGGPLPSPGDILRMNQGG